MYFALLYEANENFIERRTPYRPAHLALAKRAREDGRLLMAGAFNPVEGALLVFRANSVAEVEAFAKEDPYVVNGLIKSWRVLEWTVVIGGDT